ncbi:hypothetical protein ACX0G7_09440 [Flavitalea antarctica]
MQSDTQLLTTCQQIYSRYLNPSDPGYDAASLMTEIQQMLTRLQSEIRIQSEAGANTVLLEKMQEDLQRIIEQMGVEN